MVVVGDMDLECCKAHGRMGLLISFFLFPLFFILADVPSFPLFSPLLSFLLCVIATWTHPMKLKKKTENHKKITVFNEHFSVNSHRYR